MNTDSNLDPQILVYISRILSSLLTKNSKIIFHSFVEKGHVFDLFICHIVKTPAADFLCRVIEMESSSQKVLQLLDSENFFSHLMNSLDPSQSDSNHFALSQFVEGLLSRHFPETYPIISLLHRFTDPKILNPLLAVILDENAPISCWNEGISIISTLCQKIHQVTEEGGSTSHVIEEIVSCINPCLDLFAAELDTPESTYNGPSGPIPRLGQRKLSVTRLFADLTLIDSSVILKSFQRLRIAEALFSLFFRHSQNNFLHTNLVDLFAGLYQGDWSLTKSIISGNIFRKSKLLAHVTQAQKIADMFAELPR